MNIFSLRNDLISGVYLHEVYHRFHIFDPKHRVIHKATVRDRLVHHAVYRVLYPRFDHSFIFDSYSCRVGKGQHADVRRLEDFVRRVSKNFHRTCWVLKFDIRKFFDSVDHGILIGILRTKIPCERTLGLLENIVRSHGNFRGGVPIGNLTSQLFANVYLDAFDHFVKEVLREKFYIRYTDDAVIVHHDKEKLSLLAAMISDWLKTHRRLELHPHKVSIRKLPQGIDFLGYVVLPHHTVLRTKTKQRMFERVTQKNIASYRGLLVHGKNVGLQREITRIVKNDKH